VRTRLIEVLEENTELPSNCYRRFSRGPGILLRRSECNIGHTVQGTLASQSTCLGECWPAGWCQPRFVQCLILVATKSTDTLRALTAVPLTQTLSQTLARPSISAGVGLIYRFDPIRVEVNFGVPLVASRSDGQRRGVQVGMGLEFL